MDLSPGVMASISDNGTKAASKYMDPKKDETSTMVISFGGSIPPGVKDTDNSKAPNDATMSGGVGNPLVIDSNKAPVGKKALRLFLTGSNMENANGHVVFVDSKIPPESAHSHPMVLCTDEEVHILPENCTTV